MNGLKLFKSDVYRYTGRVNLFNLIRAFFLIEGAKFSFFLRLGSKISKYNPLSLIFFFISRFLSRWYGFQVPLKTKIGYGLYIGHFGSVIVNVKSIIGNNCNLSPGVTIGQISEGAKQGCPTIGDNVWIGTNSVIVGKITIGDNCHICPNSFVTFNVPPNSLVIGNPSIIKSQWNKSDHYILNKWQIEQ